eukprot:gene16032-21758_t
MGNSLPPPEKLSESEERSVLNYDCSISSLSQYILNNQPTNIVLMVGAGISVSAGIPDFRTPGSGLYDNLAKYNLPKPESMFDIEYFQNNPQPFYDLARSLIPSNFKPTPTHFFVKLLQNKGILKRCYSQNIDTLERRAGVDPELLVEAHGSFGSATCTTCSKKFSMEYFSDRVMDLTDGVLDPSTSEKIPWCVCNNDGCKGNVKPDIVFFGENLPKRFFDLRNEDLQAADLLIVAGTSLSVAPFSSTLHLCNPLAPRLLINRERVGEVDWSGHGFLFDTKDNYRDIELLGSCDDGVRILCDLLGWRIDLEKLITDYDNNIASSRNETIEPIPIALDILNRNQRLEIVQEIIHEDKD